MGGIIFRTRDVWRGGRILQESKAHRAVEGLGNCQMFWGGGVAHFEHLKDFWLGTAARRHTGLPEPTFAVARVPMCDPEKRPWIPGGHTSTEATALYLRHCSSGGCAGEAYLSIGRTALRALSLAQRQIPGRAIPMMVAHVCLMAALVVN